MLIFCKENAAIIKIKTALVLKTYFLKLNMFVLTYQISSIRALDRGVNLLPTSKQNPKKPTQKIRVNGFS